MNVLMMMMMMMMMMVVSGKIKYRVVTARPDMALRGDASSHFRTLFSHIPPGASSVINSFHS